MKYNSNHCECHLIENCLDKKEPWKNKTIRDSHRLYKTDDDIHSVYLSLSLSFFELGMTNVMRVER